MLRSLAYRSLRLYTEKSRPRQTFLTGLHEADGVVAELLSVYRRSKDILEDFPTDYYYRQSMEQTLQDRIGLIEEHPNDRKAIEDSIGEGIMEEVLEQAKEELGLVHKMAEWKPWEDLEVPPPPP